MKDLIRLFKTAKPWYFLLAVSTLALFAVTAVNLYVPYVTRQIIAIMEAGGFEDKMNVITGLSLLLLGLFAARAVCQFLTNYLSHVASWRLVSRLRSILYGHFQRLSMSYYHDKQTGQLMSRVINDTSTVENLVAHAIPELLANVIMLAGVLTILLTINPALTLLCCIPIPFLAGMSFMLRKIRRNFQLGQVKIAELNGVLQDNFSGMKEIQIFNRQEQELDKVRVKADEHATVLLRALFYTNSLNPAVGFITNIGTVIVLIAGPLLAVRAGLMISDVVAFLLYLNLFYAPISQLTRMIEDMQLALAGAERVFEVLDTEPTIRDAPGARDMGRLSGQLSFEGVSFSYKGGLPVLEDISFDVRPGEMVALVGPTGVGKTTISALITRFYDPDGGRITMDGTDVRDMTLESLRNQLSLVPQDVFLFNGTVSENIAYGCEGATREQIARAARTACIADYIESLPEGYDTVIGERGVRLSGGQKQRISIARSVLRNSPVLVLDEATSSVDTETEREIQQAVNSIAGTRTLIVIAHRLSTIRSADKIIVLENGRIVEQGRHDELVTRGGAYARLCDVQAV
ncbi:MAG: ABC transporter ATP-binding protein/permease [Oscillospiraceae bacterium]|nr:ABC transporter ATP-binding protein/permease [Oscillospiraceae bacterium]